MKSKPLRYSDSKIKVPYWLQIVGWLISLCAFSVGFWHAHLGLKQFGFLSSQYGSFVIAGLILLLLFVSYNRAIAGVRKAIYFYLICASFMFIFNLNSFYPTYLGEKLIKEDASAMKDTLTKYSAKIDKIANLQNATTLVTLGRLIDIKESLLNEIQGTGIKDFGYFAKKYLKEFNRISGDSLSSGSENVGTSKDLSESKNRWANKLDAAIKKWYINSSPHLKNGTKIIEAKLSLDTLKNKYSPILEFIMTDTATLDLSSPTKLNQIVTMGQAASQFDIIGKSVNEYLPKHNQLPKLNDAINQVAFPPTKELGRFAFTISSIKQRIDKIDTWMIILLCLLIDFLVPLGIFYMIKDNENKTDLVSIFRRNRNYNRNE